MTLKAQQAMPKTFLARMAISANLSAQVTDARMYVSIRRLTEVIAEEGPEPGDVTILWPYGDGTAQAVVDRSFLLP